MHYIGIDIGGTTIKGALVDQSGTISELRRAPTPSDDLAEFVRTVADIVTGFQAKANVAGVGMGVPGLRSTRTRTIETSPHIPCLRDVNLEDLVGSRVGLPVITENDANAGAYGEWAAGAGRGLQHMVYITLGTGLGCGMVLSGEMFRGVSGYAGEFGHTAVEPDGRPCACGSFGCLETRVSGTGMLRTAQERGLQEMLTAESIYDAAIGGDARAHAVFEETGRFLGMACANLINLLNPEMIVVGGGVMASGDLLLDTARKEATRRAFPPSARDCPIVQSRLWPDSGTIGAAMLIANSLKSEIRIPRSEVS